MNHGRRKPRHATAAAVGIAEQYHNFGVIVTTLALQSAEYGANAPESVSQLMDERRDGKVFDDATLAAVQFTTAAQAGA